MCSSEASPDGGNPAHPDPSLRRPALALLAATGVLLFAMFLVIQSLAGANRPHELHSAPWVAGITLLNLIPCAGVLRGLALYARANRGGLKSKLGFHALVLGLVVVAALDVLFRAGGASPLLEPPPFGSPPPPTHPPN